MNRVLPLVRIVGPLGAAAFVRPVRLCGGVRRASNVEDGVVELVYRTQSQPSASELSELLFELGATSVDATDADAGSALEEPIFREPPPEYDVFVDDQWRSEEFWSRAVVRALAPSRLAARLEAAVAETYPGLHAEVRPVEERDWVAVQEALRPPLVVGKMRVVLPWHDSVEPRDLRLEGGAAFGTGEHPTTKMCVLWLQDNMPAFATVMDYGTGSGILALASLKAGAATAVGVDVDVDAIAVARRNAELNDFAPPEVSFHLPPVGAGADAHTLALVESRFRNDDTAAATAPLPENLAGATYDVVVANILLNPLLALKDTLCGFVEEQDGKLVISGIRRDQFAKVRDAYAPSFPHGAVEI
ncbi:hypothetical protein CTAYLR_007432 [Chrysophaeum taylorii]|uniref:ETFB lysine methyltransferase n=1 Tax=Chrysophaeum taylorii TaxID=2483200 RepID=A0AAD7U9A8_9STRA|nr:hypothetical protein CTAYLR_007432 [Chrysophaeum taylorii]